LKPGKTGAKVTITLYPDVLEKLRWTKGDTIAVARGTDEDLGWCALLKVQGKGFKLGPASPKSQALRLIFTAWEGISATDRIATEPCEMVELTLLLDGASRKGLKVQLPKWAGRPAQRFQDVPRKDLAREPIGNEKPVRPSTDRAGVSTAYDG
jgi:hypothetical protein